MAIPSRQIGWSTKSNLLWQISKQLEALSGIMYARGNPSVTYYNVAGCERMEYHVIKYTGASTLAEGTIVNNATPECWFIVDAATGPEDVGTIQQIWNTAGECQPCIDSHTTTTTSTSTSTTTSTSTSTTTTSTSTSTTTTTTTLPPVTYYYNVTGYSCGTPCNNIGALTASSIGVSLTIGLFYNNPENRGYSFEILEEISPVGGTYDLTGEPGYATCTDACVPPTTTTTTTVAPTTTTTTTAGGGAPGSAIMDVYNTSSGVCTTLAFSEFGFYSPNPIMAGKWYTLATGEVVYACYIISLGGGSGDNQVLTDERDTCNL